MQMMSRHRSPVGAKGADRNGEQLISSRNGGGGGGGGQNNTSVANLQPREGDRDGSDVCSDTLGDCSKSAEK